MSVFISYSRKDAEFVNKLSSALLKNNVKVWKDTFKIVPGDSLLSRIQTAIQGASYFCVVLSQHALASKWVKEEMNEALLREGKEKGIVILPLLIDDCEIPPVLSDRICIDFRADFAVGLRRLLGAVEEKYNIGDSARIGTDSDYYFDYSIEQKWIDGRYFMQVDVVSFDKEEPFSILSQFMFRGNEYATPEHFDLQEGESMRDLVLRTCAEEFAARPARIKLKTKDAQTARFTIADADDVICFDVETRVKWVGGASRGTVLFNLGALFWQICVACGIEVPEGETGKPHRPGDDRPLTIDASPQ